MRTAGVGVRDVGQVPSAAIGRAGQPPPDIAALFRLPLCSCGYWRKSNGLRAGQRPSGRRYGWLLSWVFRRWSPGSGGGPGQDAESICISAGHRPGRMSCQDCQSVGIYSPDQCPGQDSNLRSRLRRGLLCTPLTRERAAARPARAHIGRSPPNCGAPPRWPPMASHGWRYDTNTPSKCVHQRPPQAGTFRDVRLSIPAARAGRPRTRANETKIETTRPMALKLVGSVRAHELRGPVASGGTGPAGLAVECADHPPMAAIAIRLTSAAASSSCSWLS